MYINSAVVRNEYIGVVRIHRNTQFGIVYRDRLARSVNISAYEARKKMHINCI